MVRQRKVETWFLAMWDQTGLEALFDLSATEAKIKNWEKEIIFSILKEEKHGKAPSLPLQQMILRAKFNPQRHYEIYSFQAQDGIDEETIRELFRENPQYIVDFIRKNGSKIFSDRQNENEVVIR